MKKFLSLMLVAAMVLSMAVVGNAANVETNQFFGVLSPNINDADAGYNDQQAWHYGGVTVDINATDINATNVGTIAYGDSIYFPLVQYTHTAADAVTAIPAGSEWQFLTSSNDVKGMTVRATWDKEADGRSFVEGVSIVKKKLAVTGISASNPSTALADNAKYVYGMDNQYIYVVEVSTKDRESTKAVDVYGTLEVRKSKSSSGGDTWLANEKNIEVDFTLQHDYDDDDTTDTGWEIFNFSDDDEDHYKDQYEDYMLELNTDDYDYEYNYFTVNTIGQSTMLMKTSISYNSDVADMYPTANLDFFNGYGATFNRIGELTLGAGEAGEDSEIYAWNTETNTLSVIPESAKEYDEWENAWKVNTRTLGGYVISDRELTLTTAPTPEPSTTPAPVEPEKENVSTGAAL